MQWQKINWVLLLFVALTSHADEQLVEDLRLLTSPQFAGREAGSEAPNHSAKYVFARFSELGYSPSYQRFSFQSGWSAAEWGHNVIAYLPCSHTSCKSTVVITAHYDHLGGTGKRYYPGANDNASGVAALLHLAKELKVVTTNQNVYFVATDAEEKGLHGAYHFAKSELNQNTSLNINLDMLAVNNKRQLYILSSRGNAELKTLVKSLVPQYVKFRYTESSVHLGRIAGEEHIDWLKASDHYAFHRQAIPFIYIGMGVDQKHHTTDDSFERVKLDLYQGAVSDILLLVKLVLSEPDSTH